MSNVVRTPNLDQFLPDEPSEKLMFLVSGYMKKAVQTENIQRASYASGYIVAIVEALNIIKGGSYRERDELKPLTDYYVSKWSLGLIEVHHLRQFKAVLSDYLIALAEKSLGTKLTDQVKKELREYE